MNWEWILDFGIGIQIDDRYEFDVPLIVCLLVLELLVEFLDFVFDVCEELRVIVISDWGQKVKVFAEMWLW